MKKILIIINNFGVGGAERLVIDQSKELLSRKDIFFKIITIKKEGKNTLSDQLNSDIDWTTLDFKGIFDFKKIFFLYKEIREYNPDIIFTHLWFSNTLGRVIGKLAGVKKIISFEHNVYDKLKTKKMFVVDWFLQIFSYKIVAVSEAVKNSLIRHKINKNKIEVILNGIDVSKYDHFDIKELDGKVKEDFTFVFIGRLIYQKGVDILIKSFSLLKGGKLIIVGDGAERKNLENLVNDLGINERVKFLGIRKDIPEILSYSDCFVLPSRYEGLPMVLLEAIASKQIIIVSDFESAREIIDDGINGMVFPIEKELILKDKLLLAMNDDKNIFSIKSMIAKTSQKISIVYNVDKILYFI
ncbi:MAG: glycosyltransferase [Candidatus Paceibacterota bacterium]